MIRYITSIRRAKVIHTIDELDKYPWAGHRALLGKSDNRFQGCAAVLLFFADKEKRAREAYREFVEQGVSHGHRPEFTGGGLIRSLGRVKDKGQDRVLTDERILGTGEFVKQLIEKAICEKRYLSPTERIDQMLEVIQARCAADHITPEALTSGSKSGGLPKIRSELALQFARELGLSYAQIGRHLGITTSGVCKIVVKARGRST